MNNSIQSFELVCNHSSRTYIKPDINGVLTYVCEICTCKITTKWNKYGRFYVRKVINENISKQVPNIKLFLKN